MADEKPDGLKRLLEDYLERSSIASTLARSSAFAGIAIIWLFKQNVPDKIALPEELISPLIHLVIFLIIDFFHYFIGTIVGGITHRLKADSVDRGTLPEKDVEFPGYYSTVNWIVWFIKMIPFIIGYFELLDYLLQITTPA